MAAFASSHLVIVLFISAMVGYSSAAWCVCKEGSDAVLQKTLDYACGAGADCNPIHQTGSCWNPNTVRAHCSYAVNSFFQKKGQAQGTCDFAGTATISSSDPSASGCAFPASASTSTGTSTGTSTTPGSTSTTPSTSSTSTGTGTTPTYSGTPGVLGGIGSGVGPSGMNTDVSHGGFRIGGSVFFSVLVGLLGWSWMIKV